MPANTLRKYRQIIDLVEDLPGADRAADLLRVEITGQAASTTVDTNLTEVSGTAQSGADWTTIFQSTRDAVELIDDAVQSNAADELRARVFGPDARGVLQQSQVEAFDVQLSVGSFGVATWGDRALRSVGEDHYQSTLFGPDTGSVLQEVNVEAFDTDFTTTDIGLATWGDRALRSVAEDFNQVVIHGEGQGGVIEEVGVEAFNSAADQSGFALLTYGDRALQTQADDEFRSRQFAIDGAGVLQQINAEAFDTALAATDIGVATWGDRALQAIGQDEFRSRIHDSTGTQIDPSQSAEYPNNAASQDLVGTGDLTITVSVEKSNRVIISANSTDGNTWSASVRWLDPAGTEVMAESNVDIGLDTVTEASARLDRKGAQVEVTFTDESGAATNNIDTYVDAHR